MEHSAIVIRASGEVVPLDHRPTLEEAQGIVGGWIEIVKARSRITGKMVTLVLNEEGRPTGLPYNEKATSEFGASIYSGFIVGDIIVLTGWRTVD